MRVIISAGGTGGHIYPAIAIIEKIMSKDKNSKILYIGTTDRMEKDIIPNMGIDYEGINVSGLSKNPIKCVKSVYLMSKNIGYCKKIIKKFKPDIVIGVGGYVTVPVILAAHKLGVKTILHEQNSRPGKANKLLSRYADVVCVSMEDSKEYFKKEVVYTGNPRAEEVHRALKADKKKYGLRDDKKLVLITTGSLGATTVNNVVKDMLPMFKNKDYDVLFVTGSKSYNDYKKIKCSSNVHIVPYIDNMPEVMKVTDLIISRAGATTLSEITALGIPSILIPSPYVENNHQVINAKSLEKNEATIMIEEKNLTTELLFSTINDILSNKELYKKLKSNSKKMGMPNSATNIYKEIEKVISR